MKVSFANDPDAAPAVDVSAEVVSQTTVGGETVTQTHAVATIPAPSVPARVQAPVLFDEDNIGFDDVNIPRINIVQKVGELSNVYTPGEIVLNSQIPIYTPAVRQDGNVIRAGTEPLVFTVLGFQKKRFVEKVQGGGLGAIAETEEGVVALGGTLNYKEHQTKTKAGIPSKLFQPLSTALILLQQPEHIKDEEHAKFPYECEGKYYALTFWAMKGTAFTNGAKTLFTARKLGHLRSGGYPSYSWKLGTKLETYSFTGTTNYAHIPVLENGPKNSDAFVAFTKNVLGQ